MKILITGSSGFLGSHFIHHFAGIEDVDIWTVDINPSYLGLPGDVMDMVEWLDGFDEQVDRVYHFASPVGGRMKIELDPMYNADALRLDQAIFRWAVEHATTLIYPSSSAVYPVIAQKEGSQFGPLGEELVDGLGPVGAIGLEVGGRGPPLAGRDRGDAAIGRAGAEQFGRDGALGDALRRLHRLADAGDGLRAQTLDVVGVEGRLAHDLAHQIEHLVVKDLAVLDNASQGFLRTHWHQAW